MSDWRILTIVVYLWGMCTGGAVAQQTSKPKLSFDDALRACYQVGRMKWTSTFHCRDFTLWFFSCMEQAGFGDRVEPLDVFCEGNCKEGRFVGHRFVIYRKGDLWCPGEPQNEAGGEVKSCCSTDKEQAKACAASAYCNGLWWDLSGTSQQSQKASISSSTDSPAQVTAKTLFGSKNKKSGCCTPRICIFSRKYQPAQGTDAGECFPVYGDPKPTFGQPEWKEEQCDPRELCAVQEIINNSLGAASGLEAQGSTRPLK